MYTRIKAKPGAAKFKPVRQAPKKPPNPAAVRAAAPSGPSPSPAPVVPPAAAAAPAPTRSEATAAKDPDLARKADAVASRPGVAVFSADSQDKRQDQPAFAPSGAAVAPDSVRPAGNQEALGHSKDAALPQVSSDPALTVAPTQQRSPSPVPLRATGSTISFGSLAAFEAQHNNAQRSPPSSPPPGTHKPELPVHASEQLHAPRDQSRTQSQPSKAAPVSERTPAASIVGLPSVHASQTPISPYVEQHAYLPSGPHDVEQRPVVGWNSEGSSRQAAQTPTTERLNPIEPVPLALPQDSAALDPALVSAQEYTSLQAASPQQATNDVSPLPGPPQAQEIPPPLAAQLPPLPPESMLNSDDALMELIRAEVNAADENAVDTDDELEGSIYAPSGVGKDPEGPEPQDALPDEASAQIESSSSTTRSGRKRTAPAGTLKKASAAKRQRAGGDAAAEPEATAKGKAKAKAKAKPKAKPKPKPKVQEPRGPPAEKNTIPRSFQPSVPGATLTMADILRGLELPPPPVVVWRTGQDAPAGRSARSRDGSASAAVPDGEAAGRAVSQATGSGQEGEEEEADDLALEGTRAIDPLAPLDPSRITMKSLIRDSGRGRPSSFMQRKIENRNEKRMRMAAARERMKLQVQLEREGVSKEEIRRRLDGKQREQEQEMAGGGEVEDEDLENGTPAPSVSEFGLENEDANNEADRQSEEAEPDVEEGDDDDDDGFAESQYAPQMRFVNGEMVVDEASTQIARVCNTPHSEA